MGLVALRRTRRMLHAQDTRSISNYIWMPSLLYGRVNLNQNSSLAGAGDRYTIWQWPELTTLSGEALTRMLQPMMGRLVT